MNIIERLSDYQLFGFKYTSSIYSFLINKKIISTLSNKKILDFGCGVGGSSVFFKSSKVNVDCVDINTIGIDELLSLNYIDKKNIFLADGFKYLDNNKNKYDYINISNLSPDIDFSVLFPKILSSLRINGKAIIFSDYDTIRKVENILKSISQRYIHETYINTNIIIIENKT